MSIQTWAKSSEGDNFTFVKSYCYISYVLTILYGKRPCMWNVEEKPDSIRYTMNGKEYFFCSTQCLNEFRQPEKN